MGYEAMPGYSSRAARAARQNVAYKKKVEAHLLVSASAVALSLVATVISVIAYFA